MVRRADKSESGFTLLEFLVAMTMVAIIMPALVLAFSTALQAGDRIDHRSASAAEARHVLSIITHDLESAYLPKEYSSTTSSSSTTSTTSSSSSNTSTSLSYTGWLIGADSANGSMPADTISFTALSGKPSLNDLAQNLTPADTSDAFSEYMQVNYSLQPGMNGGSSSLVRDWASPPGDDETGATDEDVISDRVVGLNIEYYDGTQWLDSWDTTQSTSDSTDTTTSTDTTEEVTTPNLLPVAIRVSVVVLGDDGPQTYSTTVSIPMFHTATYTIESSNSSTTTTTTTSGGNTASGTNSGR